MQRPKMGSTVRNLLVDGTIFAGFLLATDPRATGQTIHEWLGLAFGAGIITHLLLHWKWIVNVVRRFFRKLPGQVRINSLLNSLLFITVTLIIFSGILMSKVVLSSFGLSGSHDAIWRWLHSTATNAALIMVGLHVALHWKWIVGTLKRYLWQPLSKARVTPHLRVGAGVPSRAARRASAAPRRARRAARNLGQAQKIPHPVGIRNDTAAPMREQGGVR